MEKTFASAGKKCIKWKGLLKALRARVVLEPSPHAVKLLLFWAACLFTNLAFFLRPPTTVLLNTNNFPD